MGTHRWICCRHRPDLETQKFAAKVLFLGETNATYLPISSRVNLSTGRPSTKWNTITRRPLSLEERRDIDEGIAEIDTFVAEKLKNRKSPQTVSAPRANTITNDYSDESE